MFSLSFIFFSFLLNLCQSEYIDLTFAFNENTPLWPGRFSTFNVEIESQTPGGFWVASKGFCISEHTSTHIDAPYHFNQNGWKLDEIPLDTLLNVPGVMIDIYDKIHKIENGTLKAISSYVLSREDILEWEQKNGQIPAGAVILLRTGWSSRWPDKTSYLGLDKNSENEIKGDGNGEKPTISLNAKLAYPGFSGEAAQFLVTERQANGAGIDCIGIDPGFSTTFPAHRIFLGRNKYLLENVANLHLLPPNGFQLWIVPFKVDKGTGAPTRVLAKLNDN